MIHHLLSHTNNGDWLKVNQFSIEQLACRGAAAAKSSMGFRPVGAQPRAGAHATKMRASCSEVIEKD